MSMRLVSVVRKDRKNRRYISVPNLTLVLFVYLGDLLGYSARAMVIYLEG